MVFSFFFFFFSSFRQGIKSYYKEHEQHENNVVAAGGQFYPLIVETFGVWTPFAGDTRRILLASNGLSPKCAFRNLIQQLPVCLWRYDAKTVLRYWGLHPVVEETVDYFVCLYVCVYFIISSLGFFIALLYVLP